MKVHSIKFNAIINSLYTFVNVVFPIITFPYVSRVLLVEGVGKVNFFSSISGYAILLAGLGIGIYGIREVSKTRDDRINLANVTTELFRLNLIITGIVLCFYLLVCLCVDRLREELFLIALNFVIIFSAPFSVEWFLSGMEQYTFITKRNVYVKIFSLILIFLFVKDAGDYVIYAGIIALSSVLTNFINFFYARTLVDVSMSSNLEYSKHIKPMMLLFGSVLAVSVYINLDTVMLGFICGDREVGLYVTAVKVKGVLLALVNAVSIVMLPRLSYYLVNKMNDEYNALLKKSIDLIFFVTVPLSVFFILKSYNCVYILGGSNYSDATLCMQILMPILIISGLSNIVGNQILIPKGKDKCYTKSVSFGALVDIVLNFILMKKYGCYGAAIATLLAEICQMSCQCFYAKDELIKNIITGHIAKISLASFFGRYDDNCFRI